MIIREGDAGIPEDPRREAEGGDFLITEHLGLEGPDFHALTSRSRARAYSHLVQVFVQVFALNEQELGVRPLGLTPRQVDQPLTELFQLADVFDWQLEDLRELTHRNEIFFDWGLFFAGCGHAKEVPPRSPLGQKGP